MNHIVEVYIALSNSQTFTLHEMHLLSKHHHGFVNSLTSTIFGIFSQARAERRVWLVQKTWGWVLTWRSCWHEHLILPSSEYLPHFQCQRHAVISA